MRHGNYSRLHHDPQSRHRLHDHQSRHRLHDSQSRHRLHDPQPRHRNPTRFHHDPQPRHRFHHDPQPRHRFHHDPQPRHRNPTRLHHDPQSRHRNPHSRLHHDPLPRPRNLNLNLPLPRPNQLTELELRLPPSPPAEFLREIEEAAFRREIEENMEEFCDFCGHIPIISFVDFYRLAVEVRLTDDSGDGDGDESGNVENDDDESDEEQDEDAILFAKEIIRQYLQNRNYSVINLGKEGEEGEGEICVVCLNKMEGKEVFKGLDCGHNYHEECIAKWLLRKNSCPICVSPVIPLNFYAF